VVPVRDRCCLPEERRSITFWSSEKSNRLTRELEPKENTMNAKPTTRRKVLLAVASVLTAGALAVGSGASFTAQTLNSANAAASGSVDQTNSLSGASIYNLSNMKPGDTVQGYVTIKNSGTLAANLKLTESAVANTFETGKLRITVTDVTGATPVVVVSERAYGTVGSVDLGPLWAAGESRSYVFKVTLDASATDASEGKAAGATYTWDSTQDTTPVVTSQHFPTP